MKLLQVLLLLLIAVALQATPGNNIKYDLLYIDTSSNLPEPYVVLPSYYETVTWAEGFASYPMQYGVSYVARNDRWTLMSVDAYPYEGLIGITVRASVFTRESFKAK